MIAEAGGSFPRNLLPYALLLLKSGQWANAVAAYNKALFYLPRGCSVKEHDVMNNHSHFSADISQPKDLATAIYVAMGIDLQEGECTPGAHPARDTALNDYKQALRLEPDSPLANLFYAEGLKSLGRRTEATAAFQKASSLSQGDIKAAADDAMGRR